MPKTINDHSIMTRIEHNGVSQLNLGDAGISVISSLIKQSKQDNKIFTNKRNSLKETLDKTTKEFESVSKEFENEYLKIREESFINFQREHQFELLW